jgi:hypothetical protein
MSLKKRFPLVPFLLVLIPVWLIASAGFALVQYFKNEKQEALEAEQRFARSISTETLADDVNKIVTIIGERNTARPEKLSAISSMIRGLLGPSNTGYEVESTKGPANFPILRVSVPAPREGAAPVWVITSYDSPPGSRGAEKNATGLAATLACAQALANASPEHPIHFLFLPHANEPEAPVLETALAVSEMIGKSPTPKAILCIEAMGDAETLILTSRDTEAIPSAEFEGLGEILGAEVICLGDDFDLASTLFETGIPAIRIATRPTLLPDEKDDKLPFAPTLTASTGRLLELVKRLAKIPTP